MTELKNAPSQDGRPLLTAADVAARLNVSIGRAYEAARIGLLPSVRIGRQVRFRAADIDAFIANGGRGLDAA